MRAAIKTFPVLLFTFVAVFSLSAVITTERTACSGELYNYEMLLNQAERNFWMAAFSSRTSSTRSKYNNTLHKLKQSANKIGQLRRRNDSRMNYGDLNRPGPLLDLLLADRQEFKQRFGISYSGLSLTTFDEVKKELRKKGLNYKQRTVTETDISIEEYQEVLDYISDKNLEILVKKFNSNSKLRPHQRDFLVQTAQKFYTIITNARLTIFKLRKNDPLFQRQNRSGNNRK